MKQLQPPYRLFPCGFSLLVALGSLLLISNYLQVAQTQAQSLDPPLNTSNTPPLRWLEFPVVTSTVRAINVYKNTILWSAYIPIQHAASDDYVPYPPPEADSENDSSKSPTIPEERWDICLYNSLDGSLKMLGSGGDLDYPDMYGDWVVMDRNHYIGTLRAENIATGEERDIWYKTYEEHSYPNIYQDIVVSSPDNKTLMAYNLVTQTFTNIAYIPDYPDLWMLTGEAFDNLVIWQQTTHAHSDLDLLAFDLANQITSTITAELGNEYLIGMRGNMVYWLRDGAIYGRDLVSEEPFFLDPPGDQGVPIISGDWLAWVDNRYGGKNVWTFFVYHIPTGQEYELIQETKPIAGFGFDGSLIAWAIDEDGGYYGTHIKAIRLLPYSAFLPLLQR